MTAAYPHSVEVITSVQRRRRWSDEEKLRIVSESYEAGVSVAAVARRHELNTNQLHMWRRQVREGQLCGPAGFVPVRVAAEVERTCEAGPRPGAGAGGLGAGSQLAEIVFPNGCRLRVSSELERGALARLVTTLLAAG